MTTKRLSFPIIAGAALIVLGVLFLLDALGVARIGMIIVPLLFGLGGLAFWIVFLANRTNWWALIPGCALLGLALLIGWGELAPDRWEGWGVTLFLGMISLSFWIIYALDRANWWAIIPGGVLATLALLIGLSSSFEEGPWLGGVFFLGLAATFGLLWLLSPREERLSWALIPAAILLVIGAVLTFVTTALFGYLWPVALILAGLFLILRLATSRPRP